MKDLLSVVTWTNLFFNRIPLVIEKRKKETYWLTTEIMWEMMVILIRMSAVDVLFSIAIADKMCW